MHITQQRHCFTKCSILTSIRTPAYYTSWPPARHCISLTISQRYDRCIFAIPKLPERVSRRPILSGNAGRKQASTGRYLLSAGIGCRNADTLSPCADACVAVRKITSQDALCLAGLPASRPLPGPDAVSYLLLPQFSPPQIVRFVSTLSS